MSQKKVDEYKKNKKNRESESKKEVRRRRLEIGIVLAIIIAGLIWFIVASVSNSTGKTTTVSIDTEAIDNYTNEMQTNAEEDEAEAEADTAEGSDSAETSEGSGE